MGSGDERVDGNSRRLAAGHIDAVVVRDRRLVCNVRSTGQM